MLIIGIAFLAFSALMAIITIGVIAAAFWVGVIFTVLGLLPLLETRLPNWK